jgi:hypothetical protein
MTKPELQVALAAATETTKRTAGVFLDTLSTLAHKAVKNAPLLGNPPKTLAGSIRSARGSAESSYQRGSRNPRPLDALAFCVRYSA